MLLAEDAVLMGNGKLKVSSFPKPMLEADVLHSFSLPHRAVTRPGFESGLCRSTANPHKLARIAAACVNR